MSYATVARPSLASRVKSGLAWSTINNLVLRLGGLVVGVLLARILSPEIFGIYAVGLTAQTILQTLAELGMSADLIRHGDIARRAPTVGTIGVAVGAALAIIIFMAAEPVAQLLGDSAGAPVIRVLAITLILSGGSAVPFAIAQREFMQKKQFAADAVGMIITTAATFILVGLGFGVMALAWSRIAGQTYSTVAQFRFTRTIPRFGFNLRVARSSLAFGMPLAAANLLSWVLLNLDYMIVGNQGRAVALGFYVLAFNLSSWPTTAIGTALRSIAFPAFAELSNNDVALRRSVVAATDLAWAVALPIGFCLMVLAGPFINLVYGIKWSASAGPLIGLAGFGVFRVVFDVMASFLIARGDSRRILIIQVSWLLLLAPAMWLGMEWKGIDGAGWAHLIVAAVFIYPLYLLSVKKHGLQMRQMVGGVIWPIIAAAVAAVVAYLASKGISNDLLAVMTGGLVGLAVYGGMTFAWLRSRIRSLQTGPHEDETRQQVGATVSKEVDPTST